MKMQTTTEIKNLKTINSNYSGFKFINEKQRDVLNHAPLQTVLTL